MTLKYMHPASIAKLERCRVLAMHERDYCDEAITGASTEKLASAAAHLDFATMMSKIVQKLSLHLRDLSPPQ